MRQSQTLYDTGRTSAEHGVGKVAKTVTTAATRAVARMPVPISICTLLDGPIGTAVAAPHSMDGLEIGKDQSNPWCDIAEDHPNRAIEDQMIGGGITVIVHVDPRSKILNVHMWVDHRCV
jgi:hypothetical protein